MKRIVPSERRNIKSVDPKVEGAPNLVPSPKKILPKVKKKKGY